MIRDGRRGASQLEFVAVGVDHTTAGIGFRERLAFSDAEIPHTLKRLTDPADPLVEQAAILSTCNRVELYGAARWRPDEHRLASFLAVSRALDASEVANALCVCRDHQVTYRLAATAAGLHSLVLGESQIQGQIRKALELALAAGTAGAELRRLFESAVAAGRRVGSDTTIGRGAASVPSAGVEFARSRLGTLSGTTVLVIGPGRMGELAARQLVKRGGAKEVLALGRARSGEERLAPYGARAIKLEQLEDVLARCDLVISATGAPQPILSRDQLLRAVSRRSPDARPLLLIDLSVPRDIDPAAGSLTGVEIHTIDELSGIVDTALAHRRSQLPEAYAILAAEVSRFTDWLHRRRDIRLSV